MTRFGYFLSCEEHGPKELVRQAKLAERSGFEALWISDHYHPWIDEQGQSPFVWGVLGAVRMRMGVHLGQVERRGDHYFGSPLYRCARLMAIGHGSQVLGSHSCSVKRKRWSVS